jgi:hypothetical protein
MGIGQYPTVTLGDAHARRDVDQMTLHQMRAADQINEAARKGSRRLRLRLTGLYDAELIASEPGHHIAASKRGADSERHHAISALHPFVRKRRI